MLTEIDLAKSYEAHCKDGLSLNMARGKPSPEQLDLSNDMLSCINSEDVHLPSGTDCRNYGLLDGLPEAKAFFGRYIDVPSDQVIIGNNASLALMYDTILRALMFPLPGHTTSWQAQGKIKFLCPCPGYDRHFAICESLNIEMIPITLTGKGPNISEIEMLVESDASIKGIWCVPKYSNPTGETYSDEVVDALANLKPKADDFRIFWDNAYAVHDLEEETVPLKNILTACEQAGNEDRVFIFGSTSKISFAGGGVSVLGASTTNIAWIKHHMKFRTIGSDKLNQLRHLKFFADLSGVHRHMAEHRRILKPKFECVDTILRQQLGDQTDLATWSTPKGGYFISLDTRPGLAKQVVKLALDAGVQLTQAGATFPYGHDPLDQNIRIAPSFPAQEELEKASEILAICIKLASTK